MPKPSPALTSSSQTAELGLEGERPADRYETAFAFRWFKFTADSGLFLNGEDYCFNPNSEVKKTSF
jgi:hypothetical protein